MTIIEIGGVVFATIVVALSSIALVISLRTKDGLKVEHMTNSVFQQTVKALESTVEAGQERLKLAMTKINDLQEEVFNLKTELSQEKRDREKAEKLNRELMEERFKSKN